MGRREPRHVPTRSRKARNQSGPDWVGGNRDDWDLDRRTLRGVAGQRRVGDDDVDLESNQLCSEVEEAIGLSCRDRSIFDEDGLSFDISKLSEPLAKGFVETFLGSTQKKGANARNLRLLRLGGERRGESTGQRGEQKTPAVHVGTLGRTKGEVKRLPHQFHHGARAKSRRISDALPSCALAMGQSRSCHTWSVIERMRRFTPSQGRRNGRRDISAKLRRARWDRQGPISGGRRRSPCRTRGRSRTARSHPLVFLLTRTSTRRTRHPGTERFAWPFVGIGHNVDHWAVGRTVGIRFAGLFIVERAFGDVAAPLTRAKFNELTDSVARDKKVRRQGERRRYGSSAAFARPSARASLRSARLVALSPLPRREARRRSGGNFEGSGRTARRTGGLRYAGRVLCVSPKRPGSFDAARQSDVGVAVIIALAALRRESLQAAETGGSVGAGGEEV